MILNLEQLRTDYKKFRKINPALGEQLDILIQVTKIELKHQHSADMRAKNIELNLFSISIDLSIRTLQRWKNQYRKNSTLGLAKKRAKGRPAVKIRKRIRKTIRAYRIMFRWGSEVIQAHLKYDHCYEVSRYKIERYLDISGLRKQYPCTTRKKVKAKKNKHTSVVKVLNPGEHTQMDVKYQLHLLTNKQKCYVYNIVDHASNWSFKYAYSRISAKNTADFMRRLLEVVPFTISRLQTDNGIEFTYKWVSKAPDDPQSHPLKVFCHKHNINHKLIPPGEKELQGLVERSHRQDDQELFSRVDPKNLEQFNLQLEEFWRLRNKRRRFKKLNWMTPDEWLESYIVQAITTVLVVKNIDKDKELKLTVMENKSDYEIVKEIVRANLDRVCKNMKKAA